MRVLILLFAIAGAICPAAIAQPLNVPGILQHIEGIWGWTGKDGIGAQHSCAKGPMRIWLEDGGKIYKSQDVNGGQVIESRVALQAGKPAADQTFIMIKYLNFPQRDLFGLQAV